MKSVKPEITRDICIEELVTMYPDAVSILMDEGIRCLVCGEAVWGTLGDIMVSINLSAHEQRMLIDRLRQHLS